MSFRHGLPESIHRDVNVAIYGAEYPLPCGYDDCFA